MRVISKYLYIELFKPFLIFSFTFIGILWLVQILPKLETLVLNKQPIDIFLNVALHTIPQVAYFVIPVAAFFSTIYAINKLVSEAEIVKRCPWLVVLHLMRHSGLGWGLGGG